MIKTFDRYILRIPIFWEPLHSRRLEQFKICEGKKNTTPCEKRPSWFIVVFNRGLWENYSDNRGVDSYKAAYSFSQCTFSLCLLALGTKQKLIKGFRVGFRCFLSFIHFNCNYASVSVIYRLLWPVSTSVGVIFMPLPTGSIMVKALMESSSGLGS